MLSATVTEARIHPAIKANFLDESATVVAFALAGRVDIDLTREALGTGCSNGLPVMLRDIWPSGEETRLSHGGRYLSRHLPRAVRRLPQPQPAVEGNPGGDRLQRSPSTYIAEPPFFDDFAIEPAKFRDEHPAARALAISYDSVTTDHISPAG